MANLTDFGVSADMEQQYKAIVTEVNLDYWNTPTHARVQERLIKKFGSREKAIEETQKLLWNGFVVAAGLLKKD